MIRAYTTAAVLILAGILLLPQTSVFAQVRKAAKPIRVPIYTSKKDSLRLEDIKRELSRVRSIRPTPPEYDSLIQLFVKTREEVILYRNTYVPSADHITLDSLLVMNSYDEVTNVSIHNYPSEELPEVLFRCQNLESLELINTGIDRLPPTLNVFNNLKFVAIYNPATRRKIKLKENHHIQQLIIRSNHSRALPRSYRRFPALEVLDLSDNTLTRFPNGARHNKKLRELNLTNNRLTLKRGLRKHRHLEVLTLKHNEIGRVPRSIKRFSNLKMLSFSDNHISSVHPAIRHLSKLETLSFYKNELPEIPSGVYALPLIQEIDLFHNHIESISPRIREWKHLKSLHLSHNRIESLPDVIGELHSLEGLFLWENLIEQLPDELGTLKTLRFLWVNDNNLHQLPASLFHLENIEELDVSSNDLSEISESVFDFKRIKILSLEDNPWNEKTLQFIHERADVLRARDVFVHVPKK